MTLIERLRQLSRAVSEEKWGEFSMRVPPDEDRDADFVLLRAAEEIESLRQQLADTKVVLGQAMTTVDDIQKSNVMLRDAIKFWMQAEGNYRKYDDCVRQLTEAHARIDRFESEPKGWWHKEVEDLRQQLAAALSALQEVSDDWDGEHFHNGGGSFMPAVNKALGRGEQ